MPVSKIDPKVIFASEAPAQDAPAVFTNKTVGWGESRKNGGRPTIKQSNALQQETDLKILWLNENSVTPYDASIDYPVNAVTIKDGAFKIFNGSVWNLFLNKNSVGLNNVDNTSDLNKPVSTATQDSFDEIYENGACLPYDSTITYVLGSLVLRDGIIQKVVTGGTEPLIGNTDAVKVIDGNQTQKEINLYGGKKYDMPVGGYPLNSIVLLDSGGLVRSTISNNTNNPNTLLTGWVKTNAASQLFTEGGQTLQSVADEARPVTKGGTGATNAEDARANLDVYSQAEVDFAIDEAATATTPLATESVAGIAKIATTAIAQAGTNDTDILTPKKFSQFSSGFGQTLKNVTASRILGVTYTNPSDKTIFIRVLSPRITNTSLSFKVTIGSDIFFSPISSTGAQAQAFVDFYPIPPRSTYKVENGDSGGTTVILSWWEYS